MFNNEPREFWTYVCILIITFKFKQQIGTIIRNLSNFHIQRKFSNLIYFSTTLISFCSVLIKICVVRISTYPFPVPINTFLYSERIKKFLPRCDDILTYRMVSVMVSWVSLYFFVRLYFL